jgi:hypothetical protein
VIAELFAAVVVATALLAFVRWRSALFLIIVVGALQDPIRKLTPGTPAIMAVSSLPIFCAACLAVFARERPWGTFVHAWPGLKRPTALFLLSLLPATVLTFQYGLTAWPIAVIGLFGYLAPLSALLVGFVYGRNAADIRKVLIFYTCFTGVLAIGSFLEYLHLGMDWGVLGTGALGVRWVRWFQGGQVDMISGIYRSPDLMGWHAATLAMFSLTLSIEKGHRKALIWLVIAAVGALAAIMAGRRKMVIMPLLWAAVVLFTYVREGRVARAVSIVALAMAAAAIMYAASGEVDVRSSYYAYAATSQEDASQRLMQSAFGGVWESFRQSGPLGRGIGSASQGTQHIGVDEARGWQESGLSKLAVELGAPGMICALVLAATIARRCVTVVKNASRPGGDSAMQIGLAGFLVANGGSFLISHQVYGDPLVLILTAFVLGVLLSSSRWNRAVVPAAAGPARIASMRVAG